MEWLNFQSPDYCKAKSIRQGKTHNEKTVCPKDQIECDNAGKAPLAYIKTLREQLKRKMLADQIEWIYDYADGVSFLLIGKSEKSQIQVCSFRLRNEIQNRIEKLVQESAISRYQEN